MKNRITAEYLNIKIQEKEESIGRLTEHVRLLIQARDLLLEEPRQRDTADARLAVILSSTSAAATPAPSCAEPKKANL